jgi:archaellum biogenesis protein FlaJ (TadC family)
MLDFLTANRAFVLLITAVSALMFVGTLLAVPAIIVRIPSDYFAHEKRPPSRWASHHPAARLALRIGRNLLGIIFLVAGAAMLVLPGQGILTLFLGVLLLDYPGKYRAERWLISRPRLLRAVNWLRARSRHEPLRVG